LQPEKLFLHAKEGLEISKPQGRGELRVVAKSRVHIERQM